MTLQTHSPFHNSLSSLKSVQKSATFIAVKFCHSFKFLKIRLIYPNFDSLYFLYFLFIVPLVSEVLSHFVSSL